MINLDRLVLQYQKMYDVVLKPHTWSTKKAGRILEWCSKKRSRILVESHFNSYMDDSEYARILILEALARRVLIEIAPKRIKREKVSKNG